MKTYLFRHFLKLQGLFFFVSVRDTSLLKEFKVLIWPHLSNLFHLCWISLSQIKTLMQKSQIAKQ